MYNDNRASESRLAYSEKQEEDMRRALFCAVCLVFWPLTASAQMYMLSYGPANPPNGFVGFCEKNPKECAPDGKGVTLPESLWDSRVALQQLEDINNDVNQRVKPVTDIAHHDVRDLWTLPEDNRGDCEDYVLQKRHNLIKKGWPVASLLITVVYDEMGAGHAVLVVSTTRGEFVLDNKKGGVVRWSVVAKYYKFSIRQSTANPREWVTLDPANSVFVGAAPASR